MLAASDWKTFLTGLAFTLLATAALGAVLLLFQKVFPRIYGSIESWCGTRIRSLHIQRLELVSAARITGLIVAAARGIRLALVLLLLSVYVTLVFSFFPQTRGYAPVLLGYVLAPIQSAWRTLIRYVPNLITVLVVAILTRYTLKLIHMIFTAVARRTITIRGFYPEWAEPTYKIARFLVLVLAIVAVYPYIPGSESPAFKGVSVFLGVLFSLGSATAIANVMAGVVLTYTRAFQIGDVIRIGETFGSVIDKTLLVTRVRTPKNEAISVPNSVVLSSHIVNYSACTGRDGLVLHTAVTIGYDVPWEKVHDLLIAAARLTPDIRQEPAPFVLHTALSDFYAVYEINAYTDVPEQIPQLYSDLHRNIHDQFNQAGVEIMSPHYTSVRDGNHIALPKSYVPKSYEAPALRFFQMGGNSGQSAGGTP